MYRIKREATIHPMLSGQFVLQTTLRKEKHKKFLPRHSSSHDGELSLCIGALATDHLGNLDGGHCSDVFIINGNELVANLKLVRDAAGVLDGMDDGRTLIGSIDDNTKLAGRSVDLDHLLLNADVACVVLFEAGIVREDGGTAGGGNSGSGGSSEGTAAAGLLAECTAR